jgi:hypothetical protein
MPAASINTESNTYRRLLGNGFSYRIPRFQRDYSWAEEEWRDLWEDILEIVRVDGEPLHYMGYLVLQSNDDKNFDVIDGQQRLTTISVIILSALRNLKRLVETGIDADRNKARIDQIRSSYIGYVDPVTLLTKSKLTLNRNNDDYYQSYLAPLNDNLPKRGFNASTHLLRKASVWFEGQIAEYIKKRSVEGNEGETVARLIETMCDRLVFTVINVTDELNAYKVFETLNARGVRLSATDLLKNYLFSVLSHDGQDEHEMLALEERWNSLIGRLETESFPNFLRVYWISRRSLVRQSELFKAIRTKIKNKGDVFELLRDIDVDVETYSALANPASSGWPINIRKHAVTLSMFGVRQPFPLLLAARRALNDADFETLVRVIVQLSFRYNVICGLNASEQESVYSATAQAIAGGKMRTIDSILESLKRLYPNDDAFKAAFAEKFIVTGGGRNRRIVRYILCNLERQLSGNEYDFESDTFGIEHILPQSPGDEWSQFSDTDVEYFVYRIGNMIPLERTDNRDMGNAGYDRKREAFRRSKFVLTRGLAQEYAQWTPERINTRQDYLAKIAASIWRVAQFL